MGINMINRMGFEGDDREDFLIAFRTALRLAFRAGANPAPEFHNVQVTPAKGKDIDYWMLEKDNFDGATLVCAIQIAYSSEKENLVKMSYEDPNDRGGLLGENLGIVKKRSDKLQWTEESYDNLEKVVMDLVDNTKITAKIPRWMEDGDGSHDNDGLGFVFRSSSPDIIYVYKTHVYYGK